MMKFVMLATAAALMGSSVAAAGPAEEAAAAEAAKKSQEEMGGPNAHICKKLPPPTGTRLRARQICKTKAEWAALERDMQDGIRKMQRKPCGQASGGPCT